MPWIEELSEPDQLKRCIRDLVALSTLPAIWTDYNPRQIADSVAAALLAMLHADVVHVSVPGHDDQTAVEVTRAGAVVSGSLGRVEQACRHVRLRRLGQNHVTDGPVGLRLTGVPIGFGGNAMIVAGSTDPRFPSETHRLLLGIAANDAAIALQRGQAESEQRRLGTLVERSSEFVGVAGLDGKPQYLNAAACELIGLSGIAEAQRFSIFEFLVPEERVWVRDELFPAMMKTGRWRGELRFRNFKTGEIIPFFVDWFRIDDARTGRPMNVATVSRDLRAQKKLEVELRSLNESLERRVTERTAELAAALRRLRAEVAERRRADDRAKELQLELFHASRFSSAGQMAGALAHELNQPLTAVANSVNAGRRMLASGTRLPIDTVREVLDEAAAQAFRASEIIRRLRNFMTRGETEMSVEDLPTMIREAIELAFAGIGAHHMRVQLRFAPGAEMVVGNRIQLQQVLFNLLRNAHEAMARSEWRALEVTTTRLDTETIEVVVADSGPGLPPAIVAHVFEPFQTTKRDGMGLGLSICHTIVEAHGGKLRYEPKRGGGAVFRLTLPAAQD
jgi:PAS domain S-box-containing protein